jgi:hypothetical protein
MSTTTFTFTADRVAGTNTIHLDVGGRRVDSDTACRM